MRVLLLLLLLSGPVWAEGETAGDFEYYVLSLSWSPNWCSLEGARCGSPQCDENQDFGWVLHGLWPQHEKGYPSHCFTTASDPSRADTAEMADIMGTSGLAWYQWKKHGRCSGLSSDDYFKAARAAFGAVNRPQVFRKLTNSVILPASVVEQAFLEENPDLKADMITITCKGNHIQEARICLNKELDPRICGEDVILDCTMRDAKLEAIK